MPSLDNKTKNALLKAGWFPGRMINVSDFISSYQALGYSILKQAILFLQEYGDLKLEYPHAISPSSTDYCYFNGVKGDLCKEIGFEEYQDHIKKTILPVGTLRHYGCMVIAEDGSMYECIENMVIPLGPTIEESLDWLCLKKGYHIQYLAEPSSPTNQEEYEPVVKLLLESSGWYPGRDLSNTSTHILIDTIDPIKSFQNEFYDLTITTKKGNEVKFANIENCFSDYDNKLILRRTQADHLTPVGVLIGNQDALLFIDTLGRLYGALMECADCLVKYGESTKSSVNNLIIEEPTEYYY